MAVKHSPSHEGIEYSSPEGAYWRMPYCVLQQTPLIVRYFTTTKLLNSQLDSVKSHFWHVGDPMAATEDGLWHLWTGGSLTDTPGWWSLLSDGHQPLASPPTPSIFKPH